MRSAAIVFFPPKKKICLSKNYLSDLQKAIMHLYQDNLIVFKTKPTVFCSCLNPITYFGLSWFLEPKCFVFLFFFVYDFLWVLVFFISIGETSTDFLFLFNFLFLWPKINTISFLLFCYYFIMELLYFFKEAKLKNFCKLANSFACFRTWAKKLFNCCYYIITR